MLNSVYNKIKELTANEMHPRSPILIPVLMHELRIAPEALRPLLAKLAALRLIRYSGHDHQFVRLTLLGCTAYALAPNN
jgi:hypothetical protein